MCDDAFEREGRFGINHVVGFDDPKVELKEVVDNSAYTKNEFGCSK